MSIIDFDAARRQREKVTSDPATIEAAINELANQPRTPEASQQIAELLAQRLKHNEPDSADPAAIKNNLREWLKTRDYSYVHASEHFWLYDAAKGDWLAISRSAIGNDNPLLGMRKNTPLFMEVLREEGRWFDRATYSFAPQPPNVLNQLRYEFLTPAEGQHHWVFDALVESICGGKQENIEHVERLVLAKHQNPADYTLPALCLSDDGGTGKSLFVSSVLASLFGQSLVRDNLSISQATGRFNAALVGKAVVFVNEAVEDKADDNALKQIIGSRSISVEPKGIDPYNADNTALYILSGNGIAGCVKLSGTRVDRRYSVITGTKPLEHYLSQRLGYDTTAALDWLHTEGASILSDPQEVARWLGYLVSKHGVVGRVAALQGEDYQRLLAVQTPLHEQVFEAVFLAEGFTHIKLSTLRDVYMDLYRRHNGGNGHLRSRKLYEQARKWLHKNRPLVVQQKVKWGSRGTTADVFHDSTISAGGPLSTNDWEYVVEDPNSDRMHSRIDLS